MAGDDDLVSVQKSVFDSLRQHCQHCPHFDGQLQASSDGHVVIIPKARPSSQASKKRKTPHRSRPQGSRPQGSRPQGSRPQESRPQESRPQPLQQPEPQISARPSQQPRPHCPSQSSNTPQGGKLKRTRPKKSAALDWFLRNAPKATEWRKRQIDLELNTTEQYEQVIRAFIDRPDCIVKRKPYQGGGHSEHELVDLANRFALLTSDSLSNAKLQKSFASFQVLILLSYCEVLRKRGVPYETLDPIILHVAGWESSRKKLLDSAPWINGLIAELVSHGWTIFRATELFFIDALSITYLTYIHYNESQRVVQHLKRHEFTKHNYSDCLRPKYTIPGLIASLLDACDITANKPSIDEICAALGYNSNCVPKSVESIYEVYANSTLVGLPDPEFVIMGPSSFQGNEGPLTSVSNCHTANRASDPRRLCSEESVYGNTIVSLERSVLHDVVETLLAASRFGTLGKRQHFLSMAAKSIKDLGNIPLQAAVVHQQSVLLRLEGDICGSKRRIQEFLDHSSPEPGQRSHFVFGLLHLSQATNYAYGFDFGQAHKEARKWKPPSNHTQRHIDVVWDQVYFAGRTLRGQGRFNEAMHFFERCLGMRGLCESKRIFVKSSLADLYSELDYLQSKESNATNSKQRSAAITSFLDSAKQMVLPELELLKARCRYSQGFRRLLLALIEVEIRQSRIDNAEILVTEILGIYSRLNEPDIVDRLGHIRALIAWARISPLSKAEERWSDVLNWNRKYNPHEEEVFTCALVYLFICSTRVQLGNFIAGRAAFNHAMDVLNGKMPQFLIPGAGTYLLDYVRLQIESVTGWVYCWDL